MLFRPNEYNGMGYSFKDGKPCQYWYCFEPMTFKIDHSKPFIYEEIKVREPEFKSLFENKVMSY